MNSIMMKFMRSFTLVIFATFVFFSSVLFIFVNRFTYAERQESLTNSAVTLAKMTNELYKGGCTADDEKVYKNSLRMYSEIQQLNIYRIDKTGNVDLKYMIDEKLEVSPKATAELLNKAHTKDVYSESGLMFGLLTKASYSVMVPFELYDGSFGGAVIISTEAIYIDDFIHSFMIVFVIAFVCTLGFCYIIVYFITKHMIHPIREMSTVIKAISDGDFSLKVKISGNDEIAKLAEGFNNMVIMLDQQNGLHSSFIANVSHELKTPMTTISGFIDGIIDGTIQPEKQSYYLGIVSEEVKRLSRLVNTLLEVSKIEAGQFEFNKTVFDVPQLLLTVAANLEIKLLEKNIKFKIDYGQKKMVTFADRDSIYRVVYNLMENAIKFTDNNGKIILSARIKSNKIFVSVYNTGQGISPDEQGMVFNKFYKADKSRSTNRKSFGLGLYLCKHIINEHGEHIDVESEPYKHTIFTFTLPIHKGE